LTSPTFGAATGEVTIMRHSSLRVRRLLVGVALSGLLSAGTTGAAWALGADPHPARGGLPGAGEWPAAVAAVAAGVAPPDPAAASPAQVRRFWAALTERQRLELARRAPGVVGNLDGIPYPVRYAANERARRATGPGGPRPAGRLLGYDPRGDGRVTLVLGELASARRVAVIVPGSGWSLRKLFREARTGADPIAAARTLRDQLHRLDPAGRVAVVVWLGYDAPENIDRQAMRSERAVAGAGALARFVEGLPHDATVSLLCHSYGAVVCGRAAAGTRVGDLVALAAPGMDVASATGLRSSARVWAARIADDPIRFVPNLRVAGFGHGADPTAPGFGARVFRTGTASGHDRYYAPGGESLGNLARIVLERTSEVTLVAHPS
jgi:Alpha/beta hydrolase